MATSKLLLIDDDPVITAIYRDHFRAAGFEVQSAADGEEGLTAYEQFQPDVVLLDLNMPRRNGIEWLREVKRKPARRQVPIIVITAGAPEWQIKEARESEAVYVLSKNLVDPRLVVESVITATDTFALM